KVFATFSPGLRAPARLRWVFKTKQVPTLKGLRNRFAPKGSHFVNQFNTGVPAGFRNPFRVALRCWLITQGSRASARQPWAGGGERLRRSSLLWRSPRGVRWRGLAHVRRRGRRTRRSRAGSVGIPARTSERDALLAAGWLIHHHLDRPVGAVVCFIRRVVADHVLGAQVAHDFISHARQFRD